MAQIIDFKTRKILASLPFKVTPKVFEDLRIVKYIPDGVIIKLKEGVTNPYPKDSPSWHAFEDVLYLGDEASILNLVRRYEQSPQYYNVLLKDQVAEILNCG